MDWFERLTGFAETNYGTTQARLQVDGQHLVNARTGQHWDMGRLETPTLQQLRARLTTPRDGVTRLRLRQVVGDAGEMHAQPENEGALFQVASQFNLLEMSGPDITPEAGVARYAFDKTQGPACAVAAGAGTVFRNYLVPMGGARGQTAERQLNLLQAFGEHLAQQVRHPPGSWWTLRNGYALCDPEGLVPVNAWLARADELALDALRGQLAVGWHRGVQVTNAPTGAGGTVSQLYASALPVAYGQPPAAAWAPLARLVLEAAYEATLRAAEVQRAAGGSATVLLTRLGGGVFGNDETWIDDALWRAVQALAHCPLDVVLVAYGRPHLGFERLLQRWAQHAPA